MGKNRFVGQGTARLPLSEDDWIEVREQLDFGRQQKLAGAGLAGLHGLDGDDLSTARIDLDMGAFEIERILVWVTDWSFRDAGDKPVRLTRDAVERLDPDAAAEIKAALDGHVEAIEAAKKGTASTTTAGTSSR